MNNHNFVINLGNSRNTEIECKFNCLGQLVYDEVLEGNVCTDCRYYDGDK
jgi:hypothetical protein